MQKLQSFWTKFGILQSHTCEVAARTTEARDKSKLDRITANLKHGRYCWLLQPSRPARQAS
jgi:hypothetical protein